MRNDSNVVPLFKDLVNGIQEERPKNIKKTNSTTVITIAGQEILTSQAYQVIKKGRFVGWGRL